MFIEVLLPTRCYMLQCLRQNGALNYLLQELKRKCSEVSFWYSSTVADVVRSTFKKKKKLLLKPRMTEILYRFNLTELLIAYLIEMVK